MNAALSAMVLATIVLLAGAAFVWRRSFRKQAVLMVILAAVMAINVAIWTLPDASGQAPLGQELK